jgi:hypothetical protein
MIGHNLTFDVPDEFQDDGNPILNQIVLHI